MRGKEILVGGENVKFDSTAMQAVSCRTNLQLHTCRIQWLFQYIDQRHTTSRTHKESKRETNEHSVILSEVETSRSSTTTRVRSFSFRIIYVHHHKFPTTPGLHPNGVRHQKIVNKPFVTSVINLFKTKMIKLWSTI